MASPRQVAKQKGLPTYVGDVPCKNGHEKPVRHTETGHCKLCLSKRPVSAKHSQYMAKWRSRNKEAIAAYDKEYRTREYVKANRAMVQKSREQKKRRAEVKFNEELHDLVMHEAYLAAQSRSVSTGILHHVDHIVPLKNPIVCGLHSWTNIRIVTYYENLSKGNKLMENLL